MAERPCGTCVREIAYLRGRLSTALSILDARINETRHLSILSQSCRRAKRLCVKRSLPKVGFLLMPTSVIVCEIFYCWGFRSPVFVHAPPSPVTRSRCGPFLSMSHTAFLHLLWSTRSSRPLRLLNAGSERQAFGAFSFKDRGGNHSRLAGMG